VWVENANIVNPGGGYNFSALTRRYIYIFTFPINGQTEYRKPVFVNNRRKKQRIAKDSSTSMHKHYGLIQKLFFDAHNHTLAGNAQSV